MDPSIYASFPVMLLILVLLAYIVRKRRISREERIKNEYYEEEIYKQQMKERDGRSSL